MTLMKAIIIGGIITVIIFIIVTVIMALLPFLFFLGVFAAITAIAYAIFKENQKPPRGGFFHE